MPLFGAEGTWSKIQNHIWCPQTWTGVHKPQRVSTSSRLTRSLLHQSRMNNLQTWVTGTIKARAQLTDTVNKRPLAKLPVQKQREEIHSWHWVLASTSRMNCWLTSSDSQTKFQRMNNGNNILLCLSTACKQFFIKLESIGNSSSTFSQFNWYIWGLACSFQKKSELQRILYHPTRKEKLCNIIYRCGRLWWL